MHDIYRLHFTADATGEADYLMLDVAIERRAKRIMPGQVYLGFFRKPGSWGGAPFALLPDGRVDLGVHAGADRLAGVFSLHDRDIVEGQVVTLFRQYAGQVISEPLILSQVAPH